MLAQPSPKLVAAVVPYCPACRNKSYRYLSENTEQGFCLRSLECETCGEDILEAYFDRVEGNLSTAEKSSTEFLLVVIGALLVFFLTGLAILPI